MILRPGAVLAVVLALATHALAAHWDPNDSHKMHYPQMPDPNGWDVAYRGALADDWRCSASGPVDDVHLWFSSEQDQAFEVGAVGISIYADDRSDPNFSRPGRRIWRDWILDPNYFAVSEYGTGDQGWYDIYDNLMNPNAGVVEHDHQQIWQLDVTAIDEYCKTHFGYQNEAFWQDEDTIYWLRVNLNFFPGRQLGWKTSLEHFEGGAVWQDWQDPCTPVWQELLDPVTEEPLAMAFVITPEPATLSLLALGVLALLRRRR